MPTIVLVRQRSHIEYNRLLLFVILSCFYLCGCVTNTMLASPQVRAKQVAQLAKSVNWKEHTIHTNPFILKAYGHRVQSKILAIYIEGDGYSWVSDEMPSDNPTPIIATNLKIAIRDQHHYSVAYLARPCQCVFNDEFSACNSDYWTRLRFSPIAVNSTNQAVNYLKKYYQAEKIILVGYSGGGTMAALIAARRNDVIRLITLAAVLNLKQWVSQKSLTPLSGSLDPVDMWKNLVSIPQTHYVGGRDTIAPKEAAFAFADHFPLTQKPKVFVIPDFDHVCCWASDWTLSESLCSG